ncbi:MAG: MBL fold metallo-hydrolase [Actinobacteria bacterium]|uniref:Unannotated protein n=1 Tax=freshwater metagenome TaxID=449393 RepID=A0A6J5ZU44_9ZZZZ|nr:MBL fold metallo-hydrolase [Actinomycetota bacterium]
MLSADSVTFLGHSTVLIEDGGARLLTDPMLRGRIGHLRRHGPPASAEHWDGLDAVLISHLHHDHFDPRSLRMISPGTRVVVPEGAGRRVRKLGFENVDEVVVGDTFSVRNSNIEVVYADHAPGRGPRSREQAIPVGYVVNGGRRIYFAGDTDIFDQMEEIGSVPVDLALIPVWGWGPTLGEGHLDPLAAANALKLLGAKVAVPIHWGTLYPFGVERVRPRALVDPPHLFKRYASELAPGSEVRILAPGEKLALG